jgi:hypothetical protein
MTSNNGDCDCDELMVRGSRVPPPPGHDCEYVRQRTALVSRAMKVADEMVETVRDDGESNAAWTRAFSIAMDTLSKPLLNGSNGIS